MRNMKRLMGIVMLAVVASVGAQTAKADGVLLSDRSGVLLSDKDGVLLSDKNTKSEAIDIISVILRTVNGVLLSD